MDPFRPRIHFVLQDEVLSFPFVYKDTINFYYSIDEVLVDHVIASYMVRSLTKCVLYCIMNNGCRSFNHQYTLDLSGILGLCEINNATLESCPRRAVKRVGHGYYRDNSNLSAPTVIIHCSSLKDSTFCVVTVIGKK